MSTADGTGPSPSEKVEKYLHDRKAFAYTKLVAADGKLLKAFRIEIQPEKDHGGIEYTHAGEEFLYVLSGQVNIEVGDEKHCLGEDEFVHFDSSIPHRLHNPGQSLTRILVVLYAQ